MEIALMLEGQEGLTWARWQKLVHLAEDVGLAGVFRSDHLTGPHPPDQDSLELWVSLTWLASHSRRVRFGPIVSPVSFRDPVMTARMAAAVHDLSGGRLILGLGAGWQEREHRNFGYDLLDTAPRFQRFEEALEVITSLLRSPDPINFEGQWYHLRDAVVRPRPSQPVPILIGGNGEQRTLPLAARFADEWNGVFIPPARFEHLNRHLDALLQAAGRAPSSVVRSVMTGLVSAPTEADLANRLAARAQSRDTLADRGVLVGTPSELPQQVEAYRAVGVQRLCLQWLDQDDLDGLRAAAEAMLSAVSAPRA